MHTGPQKQIAKHWDTRNQAYLGTNVKTLHAYIQACALLFCGTAQYGTVRYGTVRYGKVRCSTVRPNASHTHLKLVVVKSKGLELRERVDRRWQELKKVGRHIQRLRGCGKQKKKPNVPIRGEGGWGRGIK